MTELVVVLVLGNIIVVDVFLFTKSEFGKGLQESFGRALLAD